MPSDILTSDHDAILRRMGLADGSLVGSQLHAALLAAAAELDVSLACLYRWRRAGHPRERVSDPARAHILMEYGLLSPVLRGRALASVIGVAARAYGLTIQTIYAWRRRQSRHGAFGRSAGSRAGRCLALSPEIADRLRYLFLHPATKDLTAAGYHRQLAAEFPDEEFTYSAVRRECSRLAARYRHSAEPAWRIEVPRVNARWQVDSSWSNVFVQVEPGERPRRVPLCAVIDDRTRCILYAHYVANDDAGAYATLLFHAMRRESDAWPMCGIPEALRDDNGKVFQGAMAARALSALGVVHDTAPAHHPEGKGKIERWFRTCQIQFEAERPGHCPPDNMGEGRIDPDRDFKPLSPARVGQASLPVPDGSDLTYIDHRCGRPILTLPELNALLHDYIINQYHATQHEGIATSPARLWAREIQRHPQLNVEPDAQLLFLTLLSPVPGLTRTVSRRTIRYDDLVYEHDLLADYDGAPVQVRYSHHDLRRVWCFDERNNLICEASLLPTFVADAELSRRQYGEAKARHARETRARREAERAPLLGPHRLTDLTEKYRVSALRRSGISPDNAIPDPAVWRPDLAPDPDLDGIEIDGIPLSIAAAAR